MKMKQRVRQVRSTANWFGNKQLPLRFHGAVESLESREVLAANVLAASVDTINSSGDSDDILLIVGTPDQASGRVTVQLNMEATAGSSLDSAAPQIFDEAGNTIASSQMNYIGGTASSQTVVELPAGTYTVITSGLGSTTGEYMISASVLGDVDGSMGAVSEAERLRASAAMTQYLGTGNFVTDQFYRTRGIDMGMDQYDSGFDANGDGGVDAQEYNVIQSNAGLGTVTLEFIPDSDAPVFSNVQLVRDDGVSQTDRITSIANISGTLTDEREIVQILASLDGGTLTDITSSFSIDANGDFVMTQAQLDTLAGGTLANGAHTLNLGAVDDLDNAVDPPFQFTFTLIRNNAAPTTNGIADASTNEDAAFTLDVSSRFQDESGDVLSFTTTEDLPSWLSFSNGVFSGTPENDDVGVEAITVRATDAFGLTAETPFELTVVNTNDAPVLATIPDQTLEEDVAFSLNIRDMFLTDVDVGDVPTISVDLLLNGEPTPEPLPTFLNFDGDTLSGTPVEGDDGTYLIRVFVSDVSADDETTFTLTVQNVNDGPAFTGTIDDQTTDEESAFSLDVSSFFSDPDNNLAELTFSAQADGGELPGWLGINDSGVLSGTPDDADIGTINVVVSATDPFSESAASNSFSITINGIEEDPVVANQTFRLRPSATNGTVFGTVVATDDDPGDTITFSATGGTAFGIVTIDSSSGELTLVDASQLVDGTDLQLSVLVTDSTGRTDNATITLDVRENDPPVANDDNGLSTNDRQTLDIAGATLTANDTDPDGDPLVVSAVAGTSAQGAVVTLDGTTITYDPTEVSALLALNSGDSVVDTFTYTVSDGAGGTDTATVSITVDGTGPDVQFVLRTFDTEGNEITSVDPGGTFELRVFVQDIRPGDGTRGVFSAFVDVTYDDASLASVGGAIDHSQGEYGFGTSGITTSPGLLDEVGGTDGLDPLGTEEIEVFRVQFVAGNSAGVLNFGSDATEDQIQHVVTLFGDSAKLPVEQVLYGSTTIAVGNVAPSSSGSNSLTNLSNPYDVDGDGSLTPVDALMVVNVLSGTHDGTGLHYDVDADGVASPLDALLVINAMTTATPNAPITEGTIVGDDGSSLAVDDLFAAIGDDSIVLDEPWNEVVDLFQDSPTLVSELTEYIDDLEDGEEIADFNDWLLGLQGQL